MKTDRNTVSVFQLLSLSSTTTGNILLSFNFASLFILRTAALMGRTIIHESSLKWSIL